MGAAYVQKASQGSLSGSFLKQGGKKGFPGWMVAGGKLGEKGPGEEHPSSVSTKIPEHLRIPPQS